MTGIHSRWRVCGRRMSAVLALTAALCFIRQASADSTGIYVIGDSITQGYTPYLQKSLPCVSHVGGPRGNARDSDNILARQAYWLGTSHYHIILFNSGLWDIAHREPTRRNKWALAPADTAPVSVPPERYRSNLDTIVEYMKQKADVLVFATTTDVPAGSIGRIPGDVDRYNEIAREVMQSHKVPVIDLNKLMRDKGQLHRLRGKNKVHYSNAGYRIMAAEITRFLKNYRPCGAPTHP